MAEHQYPKLHINLDINDDGILTITRTDCSGRIFSLKEWRGQPLIDNICYCLRDYLNKVPNGLGLNTEYEDHIEKRGEQKKV